MDCCELKPSLDYKMKLCQKIDKKYGRQDGSGSRKVSQEAVFCRT